MMTMTANDKFINQLLAVQESSKTGKLFTYIRSGSSAIKVGLLYFLQGTLCGSEIDTKQGNQAIDDILKSEIATVSFVSLDKKSVVQQPAMPDVENILTTLRSDNTASEIVKLSDNELVQAIQGTISNIIGDKHATKILALAEQFPPDRDMPYFSAECVKFATNFVGKSKAEELILPLTR